MYETNTIRVPRPYKDCRSDLFPEVALTSFMDEPASRLDARAATIVMRTVRNTVNTGRTAVCTIHQPSVDIFDAFDELLLLKRGGTQIYFGPIGHHGCNLNEYFEGSHSIMRSASGRRRESEGAQVVYMRDNVSIHPTQYISERISGRLKLIEQGDSLFPTWILYRGQNTNARLTALTIPHPLILQQQQKRQRQSLNKYMRRVQYQQTIQ